MLAQSSAEQWSNDASEIDSSVRRILLRGSEIIRGASDIGMTENPTSLAILARQLLEVFISLQWVISDPQRASMYSKFGLNELDRVAQLVMKEGLLSVKSKKDNSDVTEEFLSGRKRPKKGVSIEQQAREAGIFHIYLVFYRFMSLETHGKSETVINPDQRRKLTVDHLQAVGAISQAVGHVAVFWLLHRKKTDNEKIRSLLGLNEHSS